MKFQLPPADHSICSQRQTCHHYLPLLPELIPVPAALHAKVIDIFGWCEESSSNGAGNHFCLRGLACCSFFFEYFFGGLIARYQSLRVCTACRQYVIHVRMNYFVCAACLMFVCAACQIMDIGTRLQKWAWGLEQH